MLENSFFVKHLSSSDHNIEKCPVTGLLDGTIAWSTTMQAKKKERKNLEMIVEILKSKTKTRGNYDFFRDNKLQFLIKKKGIAAMYFKLTVV